MQMATGPVRHLPFALALCAALAACGAGRNEGSPEALQQPAGRQSTFADLFGVRDDPNVTLEVNRYLWAASLEVLDFLPLESADPFSGILAFGYGTPPGGGRAYRATVLVRDPALDARSLNVALATRAGPADPDYHPATEFSRATAPRPKDNETAAEEGAVLHLYREALRLWENPDAPDLVDGFRRIEAELSEHPDEWLLRWNLLESLQKVDREPELQAKLREDLLEIEKSDPDGLPISTGLRYLETVQ
jgi:hypothetical protein